LDIILEEQNKIMLNIEKLLPSLICLQGLQK